MKPLRVLALVHDYLVPPDDVRGVDVVNAPWKTEFDVTNTLAAMGHKVYTAGIGNTIGAIADWADDAGDARRRLLEADHVGGPLRHLQRLPMEGIAFDLPLARVGVAQQLGAVQNAHRLNSH